ncbi:MAG: GLPGLI family protein [Hydrotalea sp.]|nr:GLPGLI family protein [Hydrotalea sp.]
MAFRYLILLFAFFLIEKTYSQKIQKCLFEVIYNHRHVYDTSNEIKSYNRDYLLQVGPEYSYFLPFKKIFSDKANATQKNLANDDTKIITVVGQPSLIFENKVFLKEQVLLFSDKMISYERLGFQDYLVQTETPKISWTIMNESKNILDFNCQRAECKFGGREYVVWFTNELPISSGPWKFCGLPGLILEVSDKNGHITFKATEIKKQSFDKYIVVDTYKPVTLLEKNFRELKSKFERDPINISQSQLSSKTNLYSIVFIDLNGAKLVGKEAVENIKVNSKYVINNPIMRLK